MERERRVNGQIKKSDIIEELNRIGIDKSKYGLEGYCECAPFIEQDGDHWIVYVGERGNKYFIAQCATIREIAASICDCLGYKPVDKQPEREVLYVSSSKPRRMDSSARNAQLAHNKRRQIQNARRKRRVFAKQERVVARTREEA